MKIAITCAKLCMSITRSHRLLIFNVIVTFYILTAQNEKAVPDLIENMAKLRVDTTNDVDKVGDSYNIIKSIHFAVL